METSPNILILSAAPHTGSNSQALAQAFEEGCKNFPEISTTFLSVASLNLPTFSVDAYSTPLPESTQALQKLFLESHAVVIASPIWNFSIPSSLKNMIDWMGTFALDTATRSQGQLQNKPFYLIYTGGAPKVVWEAVLQLTTMHVSEAIRYFGGAVIGKYFEGGCTLGKGKFGLVVDKRPESLAKVRGLGKHFAEVAKTFATSGELPLYERYTSGFMTRVTLFGSKMLIKLKK